MTTVASPTPPRKTPAVTERTAQTGQLDQGTVGLTEEHATERQSPEGPGQAQRLGQRERPDEPERTAPLRRRQAAAAAKKSASASDEHQAPYQLKARAHASPMA